MKEVMKKVLAKVQWKEHAYMLWSNSVRPVVADLVNDTESKWDDAALNSADLIIDKFLKPGA